MNGAHTRNDKGYISSGRELIVARTYPRSFAREITQVVEFAAANHTAALDLDLFDTRRVHWEGSFHSDAVRGLANSEGSAVAALASPNADAFEYLNTFFVALDDLRVHPDGVARSEFRKRGAELFGFDFVD